MHMRQVSVLPMPGSSDTHPPRTPGTMGADTPSGGERTSAPVLKHTTIHPQAGAGAAVKNMHLHHNPSTAGAGTVVSAVRSRT